jgi:hypothetical protein
MSVRFECPSCNKSLKVREELEGKRIRCPHCQQAVRVPDDSEPRIEPANAPSPIAAGPKGPPPMPGDENTTPPYHGDPSFRSPIVRFGIMPEFSFRGKSTSYVPIELPFLGRHLAAQAIAVDALRVGIEHKPGQYRSRSHRHILSPR